MMNGDIKGLKDHKIKPVVFVGKVQFREGHLHMNYDVIAYRMKLERLTIEPCRIPCAPDGVDQEDII